MERKGYTFLLVHLHVFTLRNNKDFDNQIIFTFVSVAIESSGQEKTQILALLTFVISPST